MDTDTVTTSLYIHVPFCLQKCPYCDFFSVPIDSVDVGAYADLLDRHLQLLSRQSEPKKLESIFFGGGTPSLLQPSVVERILQKAEALFGFTGAIEVSLEANPGTIDAGKLKGLRAAGVNRLSIGVQALCDKNLHLLGRPHSAAEAAEAIRLARGAGFTNLSCDLMFALPGQSIGQLKGDLTRILSHAPEHLAIYGLTFEEGTPFFDQLQTGKLEEPDEEIYVNGYRLLHETMTKAGYRHYEISNFAKPGCECRHNLRYWQRQENLAIGAGGHSFRASGWGERRAIAGDLRQYADRLLAGCDPAEPVESFDRDGAMFETLYLGLRTAAGVDAAAFRQRFGVGIEERWPSAVRKCGNMLSLQDGRWRLNPDGWLVFNTLLACFA